MLASSKVRGDFSFSYYDFFENGDIGLPGLLSYIEVGLSALKNKGLFLSLQSSSCMTLSTD